MNHLVIFKYYLYILQCQQVFYENFNLSFFYFFNFNFNQRERISNPLVTFYYSIKQMKNKTLGIIIVLLGVVMIFGEHEKAWVVSAILIGVGSGLFFWKN